MSDKYIVATKDDCEFCYKAINLLKKLEKPIQVVDIGYEESELRNIIKFLGVTKVPFIFTKEKIIGGYTELQQHLGGS